MLSVNKAIEEQTQGHSFKTHRYCFESINVPSLIYDDGKRFTCKERGETETYKSSVDLRILSKDISQTPSLFKYFLDGSRKTYKVDDIAYSDRVYPIIAGQIGVGCCGRAVKKLYKECLYKELVISLPECANKDGGSDELFFNSILKEINDIPLLQKKNIYFSKILPYIDQSDDENYEKKGIATIQDRMVNLEKQMVAELASKKLLNMDAYLLKDGSLEYKKLKCQSNKEFDDFKNNYKYVVGVSKSFNPEKCFDISGRSNSQKIAELPVYHRTPAFMYQSSFSGDVKFSIWYVRIRSPRHTTGPFDGVLKVEKILIAEKELQNGLESSEIDNISANLINERNPVCYGADNRWANHIYPVYLTESYIKSSYMSNNFFLNLF